MAITFEDLKSKMTATGWRYVAIDKDQVVLMPMGGKNLTLKLVLSLLEDGEYLQARSIQYEKCEKGHANLQRVLEELCVLTDKYKVAKFGWDPSDGEITCEASIPIEDGSLTVEQLKTFIAIFCAVADEAYPAIQAAKKGKASTAEERASNEVADTRHRSLSPLGIGVFLLGLAALIFVVYWIVKGS